MTLPHIESFGFTTGDAEASAAFFNTCLGFRRLGEAVVLGGVLLVVMVAMVVVVIGDRC